jgi:hypothetical protein
MVVGADLMNEPYAHGAELSAESLHLDALYERIGAAIRSANPTILLMFQDSQDRFNAVWGVTRPPPFDGVVYTFHLYTRTWTPDALRRMEDHWARAKGWGIPMTVSEFNAYGYGSNQAYINDTFDTSWRADTKQFFAYVAARDIGFTFSAYAGNNSVFVPSGGTPKPGLLKTIQSSF